MCNASVIFTSKNIGDLEDGMPRLSYLKISGSPFDAGQALGRFGAAAVHAHLLHSEAWGQIMRWRDSARVADMARLVRERFPGVWQELQGLASGLQLPFDDVFLWNCRGDLWAFAPDGCTTVLLPGHDTRRITHNEDGDPGFAGHCAVAEYAVDGAPRIATFLYPGSIPGHTFAVTDNGLAITVNNMRERHVAAGVPRMVLSRAMLDAPGLEAAIAILNEHPRAGGFHLSIAHRGSRELLSVEFSALACSVRAIESPVVHANHATHPGMRDLPQVITGSSGFRQVRGDALLARFSGADKPVDPLEILGDTENERFPIWRNDPSDSDNENTMATADIRVDERGAAWEVRESPSEPVRFTMVDGHAAEH